MNGKGIKSTLIRYSQSKSTQKRTLSTSIIMEVHCKINSIIQCSLPPPPSPLTLSLCTSVSLCLSVSVSVCLSVCLSVSLAHRPPSSSASVCLD